MPLPTPQRTDPITQNSWERGMITSIPAEELPPNAAAQILNMEFDRDSNIITRNGVTLFVDTGETTRVTSMFRAEYSDGTVWILFTTGTKLFRCTESGGSLTNITGALTFPSDTLWQWVMFGDFAIGVNGATSGTNPVKVNAAGTASLLANAPFAKYSEVWNSRLWLVESTAANRNTLRASAINLPEDWTIDDDAGAITLPIDPNDGDYIKGIKAFQGSLYVEKEEKVHVVNPIGSPATIPSNLRVDIYTTKVGSISGYSIQNVVNDQLFLTKSGVMSLILAPLGNLQGALISENIKELGQLKKTSDEMASFVLDDIKQYWLSIPSTISSSGFNELWVLDYAKISERDERNFPIVRWVKFDGLVAGTAYAQRKDQTYNRILIAGYPVSGQNTKIYQYDPINPAKSFNDNTAAYTQNIKSKAFSSGSPLIRELWHRFGAALRVITANLSLNVNYYFNNSPSITGTFPFAFTFSGGGTLWGGSTWNGGLWTSADAIEQEEVIWMQFRKNSKGRKARLVALEFNCTQADQGFILKFIHLEHTKLNQRRARTK